MSTLNSVLIVVGNTISYVFAVRHGYPYEASANAFAVGFVVAIELCLLAFRKKLGAFKR